jgi:ribosomal protein S18 acetylase RimI-like enzyme
MTTQTIDVKSTTDQQRTIAVLTTAFSGDPLTRWVWPDAHQFLSVFPRFAAAFGGNAFAQGTAHAADAHVGAALWLPPGVGPDEEAMGALIEETMPDDRKEELFGLVAKMGEFHITEPHWYLPLIGVDPAQQGRGYGSALLRHALAACDSAGLPAYLESSNPRNVPLYERHGFEIIGVIQSGSSPEMPAMLRKPR